MVLDVALAGRRIGGSAHVSASLRERQSQKGFRGRHGICPNGHHDGAQAHRVWPNQKPADQDDCITTERCPGRRLDLQSRSRGGMTMKMIDLTMPIWEGAG